MDETPEDSESPSGADAAKGSTVGQTLPPDARPGTEGPDRGVPPRRQFAEALIRAVKQQTALIDAQRQALKRILRTELWVVIAMGLVTLLSSALATYWIHKHRHRELVIELNRDWRDAFNDVARTQWNRYLHWVERYGGEVGQCMPLVFQGINATPEAIRVATEKHAGFRTLVEDPAAKAGHGSEDASPQERLERLKRTLIGVLNIMETVAVMREHSVGDAHLIDEVYKDTLPRYYTALLGFVSEYVKTAHRNAWRPLDSLVLRWHPSIAEDPNWSVIQNHRLGVGGRR